MCRHRVTGKCCRNASDSQVTSKGVIEMQPKAEIEQTTEREKEYRHLLQRVQADFVNYKHRVEQEKEGQAKFAKADLILKLVPLLDDFKRAGKTMPEATANSDWAQGIKLIEKRLVALLEEEGVSKIDAEGKDFDPREHDAISYEESDKYEEGKVKAVLSDGYRLNGRVIRPAQVAVSRGRSDRYENTLGETAPGKRRIWRRYWA